MQEIEGNTKNKVNLISPLIWAYVGDAVYELYIRTHLINTTNLNTHNLHKESIKYVSANAQADMLKKIQDILTQEEKQIVKRARNVQNHHLPKNTDIANYTYSTAFEGLIGYLYLSDNKKRLQEILNLCIK